MDKKDKEKQHRLIAAVNLLAEYAEDQLEEGFEIALRFMKEECFLDLSYIDSGEAVDVGPAEHDWSSFAEACFATQDLSE